tara:strand:+ start:13832 stop:14461 length:630 start_codon:yes stop_codon:yes gene_type:complete
MSGATAVTGGVGGTTFGALSSIGSDLSVSVSFNIASELLSAAGDEQLSEDELIGLVLGFTIVFAALQSRLGAQLIKRRARAVSDAKDAARARLVSLKADLHQPLALATSTNEARSSAALLMQVTEGFEESFVSEAGRAALDKLADRRSMLDFAHLLVSICQRICVAISVQLLAQSVRAQQPSRLVRTVSLIGLATFFVFVESLTERTIV